MTHDHELRELLKTAAADLHTIAEDVRARWRANAAREEADRLFYAEWVRKQEEIKAARERERAEEAAFDRVERERWQTLEVQPALSKVRRWLRGMWG